MAALFGGFQADSEIKVELIGNTPHPLAGGTDHPRDGERGTVRACPDDFTDP